jgi:hypothetical protein
MKHTIRAKKKMIIEKNANKGVGNNHDGKKRIIFAKYKDPLGDNAYKFVGIFEPNGYENGARRYKRTSKECTFIIGASV